MGTLKSLNAETWGAEKSEFRNGKKSIIPEWAGIQLKITFATGMTGKVNATGMSGKSISKVPFASGMAGKVNATGVSAKSILKLTYATGVAGKSFLEITFATGMAGKVNATGVVGKSKFGSHFCYRDGREVYFWKSLLLPGWPGKLMLPGWPGRAVLL